MTSQCFECGLLYLHRHMPFGDLLPSCVQNHGLRDPDDPASYSRSIIGGSVSRSRR